MEAAYQKQIMKMAVQTVLHQYKPVLDHIEEDQQLLDQIASDITCLLEQMETATAETWECLE